MRRSFLALLFFDSDLQRYDCQLNYLEFLKFLNQYNVPFYLWYFIRFSANPKDRESPDHQEPEE